MAQNSKIHLTEKAGFVIFSIVGFLFLIVGFLNIKSRLSAPFKLEAKNIAPTSEEQAVETLKLKDTDKDGLSDYDETFLYNTSPYIPDSDSDGESDSVEIKASTDPNCPKGKTCVMEETPPAPTAAAPDSGSSASLTTGSFDLNKTMSGLENGGTLTASALREALKQAGMDATTLDKINDADLIKLYEETAQEQQ